VIVLHGGPALSFNYLDELIDELVDGYRLAWYQQRSLEPSTTAGPFTVAQHVADIASVADSLGWDEFALVGHSWGGHLTLHAGLGLASRISAALAVDPLGGVDDGGGAEFGETMFQRLPESDRARARELEERGDSPDGTAQDVLDYLRLVWPAYYADYRRGPSMPSSVQVSLSGFQGTWGSIIDSLPALTAGLPTIATPFGFVHGEASPIPVSASTRTAERIPGATVDVIPGAGHFIWYERPGAVRDSLDRLVRRTTSG
jgi:pimeloyl-ACP methyl ester carboxylesterase